MWLMLITTVFQNAAPEGVCEAKAWAAVRHCLSAACALSLGSLPQRGIERAQETESGNRRRKAFQNIANWVS